MSNAEIAVLFEELAELMELAGENYFKIRAFRQAGETIRSLDRPLRDIPPEEIAELPGIGKAISKKIASALETGAFATLVKWGQSGYATLRPLAGIDGMSIRILRGMIKDLNLRSLDDLKKSLDDGTYDAYKKIDSKMKSSIKEHLLVNHG